MYDNFVRSTYGSTLFHELNFLGYHKNKKIDILSYYILKKNENVGVFSVVKILEKDSIYFKSPYGASYGGILFQKKLNYANYSEIIELIIKQFNTCKTKSLEFIFSLEEYYHNKQNLYLKLSMLNSGFKIKIQEASSILKINSEIGLKNNFSKRVIRSLKKAQKLNVNIKFDVDIKDFLIVFKKTYERHGVHPTHTEEDLIC